MIETPCVLFAGGKSSRMGEDKSLLPFGDFTTLTEYQYSRLSKIFQTVYISCKDKSKFSFGAAFIEDAPDESLYAPTAGFIAAFAALQADSIFVLSVDAPFVDANIIHALTQKHTPAFDATLARTPQGLEPLCGVYSRSLEEKFIIMKKNNSHRLGKMLQSSQTQHISFNDATKFLNLNHKEEYLQALKIISTCSNS